MLLVLTNPSYSTQIRDLYTSSITVLWYLAGKKSSGLGKRKKMMIFQSNVPEEFGKDWFESLENACEIIITGESLYDINQPDYKQINKNMYKLMSFIS